MTRAVPAEINPGTGFNAKLTGLTIPDLIQLKCLAGTTEGLRIISREQQSGVLRFANGSITHAQAGDVFGDEAVLRMIAWKSGNCEPALVLQQAETQVKQSWQSLLLLAATVQDEQERDQWAAEDSHMSRIRHVANSSDGENMSINPRPVINIAPASAQIVRLDSAGRVLSAKGEHEELAAAAAYIVQVAQHIGTCLGLDPFKGCEFRAGETRTVLALEDSGEAVAIQSKRDSDVTEVRSRAGL